MNYNEMIKAAEEIEEWYMDGEWSSIAKLNNVTMEKILLIKNTVAAMAEELKKRSDTVFYKHYKGGYYKLLGFGKHESTKEQMVMYKSLGTFEVWVRPEDEFHQKFTKIVPPTETTEE